jgi:hypothetical protein
MPHLLFWNENEGTIDDITHSVIQELNF